MAQKKPTNIGELADYESNSAIPDYEAPQVKQVVEHVTRSESVVSIEDVASSKRKQDAHDMKRMINNMKTMMKTAPKIKMKPSTGYINIFGTTWTFLLNGFPITVRFDGTEQEFPLPVYERIMEKINEGMEASAPKVVNRNARDPM